MVRKRSEQDIINDMGEFINDPTRFPDLDLSAGNVVTDFIEAFPKELADTYDVLQAVEEAASLQNASTMGADGMSLLGLNFFTPREEASKATGTLTFQRKTAPGTSITIPLGASARTLTDEDTNTFVRFVTTQEMTMGSSTQKNPLTGFYEVDVPAAAELAGSMGNVGRNTIIFLETAVSGINSVTNKFNFAGGTDAEIEAVQAARILSDKVSGQTIGTRAGYKSILTTTFPGLTNVEVVGPGDPAMVRNEFGGAVDIYVAEQNPVTFQDTLLYRFGDTSTQLATRPVVSIASVVGATTGTVFSQGADWSFTKDTSAVYGGSIKANDVVTWTPGGNKPGGTQTFIATGLYDKLITDAQAFLDNPFRRVPATDLIVKEAERVYIDITLNVTAFSGYNKTDLATRVAQGIIDGLSSYALGSDVEQADLVSLVAAVPGTAEVTIPFTKLALAGEVGVSDLVLTRRELARVATITVTVT